MRVAVEGCCHGELDKIYETVAELEQQNAFKVDLLIICGDFQAVRNFDDFQAMAVPPKYQQLNTFYKYYSHQKVAPLLTIFIGGNHEASNYMQELPYGGWVAPNIYYMGYGGIVQVGGIRIGGISGIFKGHDFNKGHFEKPPYSDETKRSVYHVRNLEVFRFKQVTRPIDIFFSHDWPKGIYHYGDISSLIRKKPFFKNEIETNKLGSGPLSDLLSHLQPSHWFSAHLHVKFAAHVEHKSNSEEGPAKTTKFLALDKCLPRRNFLQILEVPHNNKEGLKIKLDPEWLVILQKTDHLLNLTSSNVYMPAPGCGQRFNFDAADSEIKDIVMTFGGDMSLPENFVQTSPPINENPDATSRQRRQPLTVQVNPQTTLLCTMLGITDPNAKFIGRSSQELLDESCMDGNDSDNDEMNVSDEGDDDNSELPSTIDSSFDTSACPSSRLDSSYETANETFNTSNQKLQKLPLSTSTPAKNFNVSISLSGEVYDDENEFLSIMSAQKSKKSDTASLCHSGSLSEVVNESSLLPKTSAEVDVSLSTCIEGANVSLNDSQHSPLKPQRSSFGMSGLCLDSEKSASNQRDSLGNSEIKDVHTTKVAPTEISTTNRLKRRNVSLYSESL